MPEPDDADRAALEAAEADLPPAGELQGRPGQDTASTYARGARLLRLRSMRLTYDQIAAEEGYTDGATARNALIRALQRHEAENVTELRAIENEALDRDERALRAIIGQPDAPWQARVAAVNSRTRLSARRSRMNGMDAPVQVQISSGVRQELDSALQRAREVILGEVTEVHDEPMPEALEG